MKNTLLISICPLLGLVCPSVFATILLNEINLNPQGTDDNFEFIELKSTTGGIESCAGLTILLINNDRRNDSGVAKNLGDIDEVWSLEGFFTGPNGLLILGDGYNLSPRGGPWAASIAADTSVGDPRGLSPGNIGPNDAVSILLVRNFTGVEVNDVWPDVDVDDNLTFDWLQTPIPAGGLGSAPWSEVVDSIGTRDFNEVNDVRGVAADPYVAPSANLYQAWISKPTSQNQLRDRDPDTFARRSDSVTPHAADQWYGAKFEDLAARDATAYRTNRWFGLLGSVTPGQPNLPKIPIAPTQDTDGDGIPDLIELALNTGHNNSAMTGGLPAASVVSQDGIEYPGFTYRRLKGGTAGSSGIDYTTSEYNYTVESSPNLQTWSPAGAALVQVSVTPNPDNVTETVVLRVANPESLVFLRLKVGRR